MTLDSDSLLCAISDSRWTALAAAHPQAHIFHHPAWARLLSESYGYRPFVVAMANADNGFGVGLPMTEVRSPFTGRHWVSLPFTDHCAPLCLSADSLRCLYDRLVTLLSDQKLRRIELRCELPSRPAVQTHSHHVLHTLPLCRDSDAVFARVSPMHRRNVRAAEKRGVRIEWGNQRKHLDIFYRLHLETRRRQGVPIQPRSFFDLLGNHLIERGLGFVLLASKDDEYLAAAVFLHWQHTLTYKYGASTADGLNLRPNNLLFWHAIAWGCENGYTLLDMGRTDLANTGLRAFKSGWGAQETTLTYSSLSTESERFTTSRFMPAMSTIIRSSPPWVCQMIGELLYRHVG